jgi:hypothetical protein
MNTGKIPIQEISFIYTRKKSNVVPTKKNRKVNFSQINQSMDRE